MGQLGLLSQVVLTWMYFCLIPYTAKLSRGETFAVGIEKDRSRENVRGSSISQ